MVSILQLTQPVLERGASVQIKVKRTGRAIKKLVCIYMFLDKDIAFNAFVSRKY